MFVEENSNQISKNTTHRVVIPFYVYASISFIAATILLFFSTSAFLQHYFHPHILAITHIMALGWGTMMILGTSHQLLPVLLEGRLYSVKLAYTTFALAAVGIPLLVYSFYFFNMGWPAKWGGRFIFIAILLYVVNIAASFAKSKNRNVHVVFVLTAAFWLFITTTFGLVLVYNYSYPILSQKSLEYLPLHAHTGIIGWFLLLVIGVGSRLIPMFLISKYSNEGLLWTIYSLINGGLLLFIIGFLYSLKLIFYFIPVSAILIGVLLFGYYCRKSYMNRIRKQLDHQLKISLLSVLMMVLPLILLVLIIGLLQIYLENPKLVLTYGFTVFFGWITSIIFGMTFKTLPFIVWNKIYRMQAGLGRTPNPKDLFSSAIFSVMGVAYLTGFVLFVLGAYIANMVMLNFAAFLLLIAALFYNWNVMKIILHKPLKS